MIYELDVPFNTLKKFIELSSSGKKTEMTSLSIIEEQDKIKEIASEIIDTTSYFYGNLFNHGNPFTIHSDVSDKKKTVLLIPISASRDQKFVMFDQTLVRNKEMSWIYNIFSDKTEEELKAMYYHTSSKSRPCDTEEVFGCTGEPVPEELFQYLPYTRDLYHGLTGWAWDYKPGKALLFPANRIHATGRMSLSKIGCTIQFKESLNKDHLLTSARILP